jgi:2-polyprenyl-3-methyl-5-hydroxy-6-metoxy-1,4-benzoquinol methylase
MFSQRFRNNGRSILKLNKLQKSVKNQIEKKIKNGEYRFERASCFVCGKKDFDSLSAKDRYGLPHSVVICKNCGLIQTNPRMSQKSYNNFYKEEYRKLYNGENLSIEEYFNFQQKRGQKIYQYLTDNLKLRLKKLKILEIGTGVGGILQYFKEQNNDVFGIDLGSEYINFGKNKYGLNLENGTITNAKIPWTPDIVIYSHTLEHILNPIEELNKLRVIINKNAYLYIEAPGVKNLLHSDGTDFLRSLQNAHVYYFTLTTLKNALCKSGYNFIYGDEFIHSIFKPSLKMLNNNIYKNDYNEAISFLKKMEWFRFLPTFHNMQYYGKYFLIIFLKAVGFYNIGRILYRKVKHLFSN